MADKPDPFDVEALGDAVNDSATRVSTIWVSFLIFALYLLTAAATVTHRQLFLAEPVKLPVLNIDLPLWGFFFLAPILFVIFHIYVLLQVMLLSRTAAAYNAALERLGFAADENASLRQRLANTLFAQIFAGSPRERDGWLGWLLKAMAWITLAIAPILILVVFQFAFLPYHSHIATWTHRLLILAELIMAFALWPLVLDARQDFDWTRLCGELRRTAGLPLRMLASTNSKRDEPIGLKQQYILLACGVLYLIVCWSLATFPGEPHLNVLSAQGWNTVQCRRWFPEQITVRNTQFDFRFDRIVVPHSDVIDHQKLEQIEEETKVSGEPAYQSERTWSVRDRDLNCGDFSDYADLRRIDLTGAQLRNVHFENANLQGVSLAGAELTGAFLDGAQLQGASLDGAQLDGASLNNAKLQGASLNNAQLQGAPLNGAQLQGAILIGTQLQGAQLDKAELQGAWLSGTKLEGAGLYNVNLKGAFLNADLRGANLHYAQLQGAYPIGATFSGALLDSAQLQGADFTTANLDHSILSQAWTWRARNATCTHAWVSAHKPNEVVSANLLEPEIAATPDAIAKFIQRSIAEIPNAEMKDAAEARMRRGLVANPVKDDTEALAKVWSDCETNTSKIPQETFDSERAILLGKLICNATRSRQAIASGIIRNFIPRGDSFAVQLARVLLSQDGEHSGATQNCDGATINLMRELVAKMRPAK